MAVYSANEIRTFLFTYFVSCLFTFYFYQRWLAAEKEDGEVERLIQASGARTCQEMLVHSAAKHIKENHLWFSIFFRYIMLLLCFVFVKN